MPYNLTGSTPGYNSVGKFGASLNSGSGSVANIIPTTGPFTLECWVKSSPQTTLRVAAGASACAWVGCTPTGKGQARYGDGVNEVTLTSNADICDGLWHHMQLVVGATGGILFVDGVYWADNPRTMAAAGPLFTRDFGVRTMPGFPEFAWQGEVDEVAVWSTQRNNDNFTPQTTAYSNTASGLVALYHLDNDLTDSATFIARRLVTPPRSNNKQPQQSIQIDWSNPITRGIQVALTPFDPRASVSGVARKIAGNETAMYSTGGSFLTDPATVGTEGTILIIAHAFGGAPQYFYDDETGSNRDLLYYNQPFLGFGWYINNQMIFDSGSAIPNLVTDVPAPIILRWTGSKQEAYRGIKLMGEATVALSASVTLKNKLLSRFSNQEMLTSGGVSLFVRYNRTLSLAEVKSLAENPWQIFRSNARKIYVTSTFLNTGSRRINLPKLIVQKQPQQSLQIDWSNPLTRDLFVSLEGQNRIDAVSGTLCDTGSTTPAYKPTYQGIALDTSSGLKDIRKQLNITMAGKTPFTLSYTASSTSAVQLSLTFGFGLVYLGGGINSNPTPAGSFRGQMVLNGNYHFWAGSVDWPTGIPWDTDGVVRTITFTFDGTTLSLYRAGVLVASIPDPGLAAFEAGRYAVLGSCHSTGTSSADARFLHGRAWSRCLSAQEVSAYSQNPWQILK